MINYPMVNPYRVEMVNYWPGNNRPTNPASKFKGQPYTFLPNGLGRSNINSYTLLV
jgi:hypothetical protein